MKKLLLVLAIITSLAFLGCSSNATPDKQKSQKTVDKKTPLYIGIMVHLEGWDDETDNEIKFRGHADAVREFADIFEKYDAKITFEARPEFVEGSKNWDDNVLRELQNRGHGIGLHADLGGNADKIGQTQKQFNDVLSNMKRIFERDTGIKIRHVSGICSTLDWAQGAIKAGFEFTTGGVAYCVMSMPEEKRPKEFKNCSSPSDCHDTFPEKIKDRIHPWKINSADDWLKEDPSGQLVFFAAENAMKGLSEEETGAKSKVFDKKDIDVYMDRLEEALKYVDKKQVNAMYVGWSIGDAKFDEELIDDWMKVLQPYVDSGEVEWKTIPEMYDEYL